MHWRTEDLLSLRDGEPLDADVRRRLEQSQDAQAELRRLDALRDAMRALPDIEVPKTAWREIEAGLQAPSNKPGRRVARALAVAAGVGGIVLATLLFIDRQDATSGANPASAGTSPASVMPSARNAEQEYASLLAESARLERMLMQIPSHRGIRQASTTSTIAGLEDQIAWIDAVMSESAARDSGTEYRNALWRERVRVMHALVDVRSAQATEFVYSMEQ